MKAARIVLPNEPLVISDVTVQDPTGTQVLVKIKAVGVCHSDLHLWEGGYDTGDGFMKVTDRGVKFPVIPGHEITGVIEKVGADVVGFSIGEKVLIYPWLGDDDCPTCKSGDTNLCENPKSLGVFQNGGYAQYINVSHYKHLAKLSGLDLEEATSLACSGLTAYTAIKKACVNKPKVIIIIGAGGLGLMGIQIAKATSSAKIICVDLSNEKLEIAKNVGADVVINSKESDAIKEIMNITNNKGVDSIIDFVNGPPTVKMGLALLRKRGNLVLVGLFGGSVDLSLVTIPLKSITIQGAYTGSYEDMIKLLDLAKKGVVKPLISKRYSLNEVNTALNDLKDRKIIGRAVINP
ncbi:MAG: alcohol dehydrogenase [Candidatus Nitrosoabyssus spongiisocia]|nr:MAG: alcohol dehydrogenase [Nitrosopumilaceae archaeon AB1(1)]